MQFNSVDFNEGDTQTRHWQSTWMNVERVAEQIRRGPPV
jgi:hypothetical protein